MEGIEHPRPYQPVQEKYEKGSNISHNFKFAFSLFTTAFALRLISMTSISILLNFEKLQVYFLTFQLASLFERHSTLRKLLNPPLGLAVCKIYSPFRINSYMRHSIKNISSLSINNRRIVHHCHQSCLSCKRHSCKKMGRTFKQKINVFSCFIWSSYIW